MASDRRASDQTARPVPRSGSAYVDESGHAQLRESIVGFLDLMGFSQAIIATPGPADAQRLVDRIVTAIDDSRRYVRQDLAQDFASNPDSWAVKFFSDNLVVGYPVDGDDVAPASAASFVIRCAQRYQLRMALNGFFLRGGLTQGPICLTDDIIFGSALLECYRLESQASIVPRVILAEPLMQVVQKTVRDADQVSPPAELSNSLCRDIDGWWFVSYLEAAVEGNTVDWDLVERHKHSVLQSLTGVTRHDVLPKFGWACRYHNMFCHWHRDAAGYSDRVRIAREDERSTICRLGDATEAARQS